MTTTTEPHEHRHTARCLVFDGSSGAETLENVDEISDYLEEGSHLLWFDLAEPSADDLAVLAREFKLHPMAIEDASLWHERPKIEFYEHYVLTIVHAASLGADGELVTHEIAIFAGERFVVTIRTAPLLPLEEIERRWKAKVSIPHNSTGLLYTILDTVVDGFFPITMAYEERLERLESSLFDEDAKLERNEREIFQFKRELTVFRRIVSPLREILNRLVHSEIKPLEPGLSLYFRDVQDHVLHVLEQTDTTRDLVNSTFDIHLATQSHHQAQISKQLTIIATIFLPLTYVTGFFGQNFGWMVSHIDSGPAFWWLGVGSEIVALGLLFYYFKRRRYF